MNEKFHVPNGVRFNPPAPDRRVPHEAERESWPESRRRPAKSFFGFIVFGLAVVAIVAAAFLYKDKIFKGGILPVDGISAYSAVFLSNGQVYFGQIAKNGELEMVLENVYYLKSPSQSVEEGQAGQQTSLELVKLGGEIHGPTNELRINRTQILFYEKLRDDSQVVEAIKSQN